MDGVSSGEGFAVGALDDIALSSGEMLRSTIKGPKIASRAYEGSIPFTRSNEAPVGRTWALSIHSNLVKGVLERTPDRRRAAGGADHVNESAQSGRDLPVAWII
jgi:hypothetical protein